MATICSAITLLLTSAACSDVEGGSNAQRKESGAMAAR